MKRAPLSRRTLLRGVMRGSLVSVALPPLEIFFNTGGTALACGGAIPKRFGIFFWGNGNLPDRWTPIGEGEGDAWSLSEQLAPLSGIKDVLTVVSGMAVKIDNIEPHWSGVAGLLTGMEPLAEDSSQPAGPTIDQWIASLVGSSTLYRSLQIAATDSNGVSYNGPYNQNPAERDPYALYERLFGASWHAPGEEAEIDPTWGLRRSALDAVMGDISALKPRLGAADVARLDQHLTGLREIEQRLATLEEDPPSLESCARPDAPAGDYSDRDGRPQIPERNLIMSQLLSMAMACDQTRVFGHYLTDPVSDILFDGTSAGHHDLTHNEPSPQEEVNAVTLQCMEHFASLIETLRSVPEGDGTLLDNCVVLGCSEVSEGQTHSLEEMPLLLAGSACGFLKTNYHYRSVSQENASKVMLTLLRSMDIQLDTFGEGEAWTDEPLSAIER